MSDVFISYSHDDRFFAELVELKLKQQGISVWRNTASLFAGTKWKAEIDTRVDGCKVLVLVLSPASEKSSYVTYEWARAITLSKSIIPIYIAETVIHKKLEGIQYLDFRHHNSESWNNLVAQVKQVVVDSEQIVTAAEAVPNDATKGPSGDVSKGHSHAELAKSIQIYLNSRGFRAMSFERIRKELITNMQDDELTTFVAGSTEFEVTRVRSNNGTTRPGLRMV